MRAFVVMFLGVVGASVGALVYFWGTPATCESRNFIVSAEFVTWFFVNEVLFATYPVLDVLLWKPLSQLRKHLHRNKLEIIGSSVILFVLFFFPSFAFRTVVLEGREPLPLEYATVKIAIIMAVGFFAAALPLSVGIWLTQADIRNTFEGTTQPQNGVKDYIRCRDRLRKFW